MNLKRHLLLSDQNADTTLLHSHDKLSCPSTQQARQKFGVKQIKAEGVRPQDAVKQARHSPLRYRFYHCGCGFDLQNNVAKFEFAKERINRKVKTKVMCSK